MAKSFAQRSSTVRVATGGGQAPSQVRRAATRATKAAQKQTAAMKTKRASAR